MISSFKLVEVLLSILKINLMEFLIFYFVFYGDHRKLISKFHVNVRLSKEFFVFKKTTKKENHDQTSKNYHCRLNSKVFKDDQNSILFGDNAEWNTNFESLLIKHVASFSLRFNIPPVRKGMSESAVSKIFWALC